jgi:hypothetical protein
VTATRDRPRAIPIASIAATSALALALATGTAAAETAGELFAQAERLLAAGKTAEACAALEASNRLEASAGTLINLGQCREKLGKLASALLAYQDALARVKDPRKKQIATARAAELEPRVSQLTIVVPASARLPGLVITRDDAPVSDASLDRAFPIDGGSYTIAATAPKRKPWSIRIDVRGERERASVTVPVLDELEPSVQIPVAAEPAGPSAETPSSFTSRRKVALAIGAVGVGLVAGGVALGISSRNLEDDAFGLCPDASAPCDDAVRANALLDRGNQRALYANVAYAAGGAAVIGAIVLWLTGGVAREVSRVTVVPRAGGPGVDVQVRF